MSCALLAYWANKCLNFLGCQNCLVFLQCCSQSNGSRPFGVSSLTVGFHSSGSFQLHQMDPSGTYQIKKKTHVAWKLQFFYIDVPIDPNIKYWNISRI
uniref:Uncharacterized protein n=1 Tax=Calidris pygmaea TaxID=425635 RepID=A0A8C3JCI3_9CHAR